MVETHIKTYVLLLFWQLVMHWVDIKWLHTLLLIETQLHLLKFKASFRCTFMIIIVGPSYKEDFSMYIQGINLKFGHVIWKIFKCPCRLMCLLYVLSCVLYLQPHNKEDSLKRRSGRGALWATRQSSHSFTPEELAARPRGVARVITQKQTLWNHHKEEGK